VRNDDRWSDRENGSGKTHIAETKRSKAGVSLTQRADSVSTPPHSKGANVTASGKLDWRLSPKCPYNANGKTDEQELEVQFARLQAGNDGNESTEDAPTYRCLPRLGGVV
jgi:hypothetical protein